MGESELRYPRDPDPTEGLLGKAAASLALMILFGIVVGLWRLGEIVVGWFR